MDLYSYDGFLKELPWIQNILQSRWLIKYSHLNVSITIELIDVDSLTLNLDAYLSSLEIEPGKKNEGELTTDLINSIWVVRSEEEENVSSIIKDVLGMKERGVNLDFLERPLYEIFAKGYPDSLYLVLAFEKPVEPDADDKEGWPFINIVILRPRNEECIPDYLVEIRDKATKKIKEELGL